MDYFEYPDFLKKLFLELRRPNVVQFQEYKKLRYCYRRLLEPPSIPRTPNAGLNLRLYQEYGHPFQYIGEALQAHYVCNTMNVALKLSRGLRLPLWIACTIVGFWNVVLGVILCNAAIVLLIASLWISLLSYLYLCFIIDYFYLMMLYWKPSVKNTMNFLSLISLLLFNIDSNWHRKEESWGELATRYGIICGIILVMSICFTVISVD